MGNGIPDSIRIEGKTRVMNRLNYDILQYTMSSKLGNRNRETVIDIASGVHIRLSIGFSLT